MRKGALKTLYPDGSVKEPTLKQSQTNQKDPMPVLVVFIAALLVGIIGVSWFFVESLQENSKSMRKYAVKPQPILQDTSSGLNAFEAQMQIVDDRARKHPIALQLYDQGRRKIRAKDYHAAIADLDNALQHFEKDGKSESFSLQDNKDLAMIHSELAECYLRIGSLQTSVDELSLAIKSNPRNAHYHQHRAFLYQALRRPDLAAADFKAAEAIDLPGAEAFTQSFLKGQQLDH